MIKAIIVGLVLWSAAPASAEVVVHAWEKAACYTDAKKFCGHLKLKDGVRLLAACLAANRDQLHRSCQYVLSRRGV